MWGALVTLQGCANDHVLLQVLAEVQVREPRIPVISNVTGQPFPEASLIPAALARQLVEPVRWEATLKDLVLQGKTR